MIDLGLGGKVALVTGANNPFGIGAAVAEAFAAQGAGVFVTYLRVEPTEFGVGPDDAAAAAGPGAAFYRAHNADPPDAVLARLAAYGGRVGSGEVDLADPDAIPRLFDLAEEAVGPVDVLVNNAAYSAQDRFLPEAGSSPVTAASHGRHVAVNSRAVALAMAELGRRHAARGAGWGRIVNVSSDGARGFPGEASYGASKWALESYSRAAAVELAPLGITVNVVSLAAVQTGWIAPEAEARIVRAIPAGRLGEPADAAAAVLFFASAQARWITGQVLHVGGGHAM